MEDFCTQLLKERALVRDFLQKQNRLIRVYREGKEDFIKMKKDLEDFASGANTRLALGEVAATIKMVCEKFNDTMELFVPEEALGEKVLRRVFKGISYLNDLNDTRDADSLYDKSKIGYSVGTKVAGSAVPKLLEKAKLNPWLNSVSMLWNFGDNLKKIHEIDEARKDVAEETKRNLDNMDKEIKKNDALLGTAAQRAKQAQIAMAQIEQGLREHCTQRNFANLPMV